MVSTTQYTVCHTGLMKETASKLQLQCQGVISNFKGDYFEIRGFCDGEDFNCDLVHYDTMQFDW